MLNKNINILWTILINHLPGLGICHERFNLFSIFVHDPHWRLMELVILKRLVLQRPKRTFGGRRRCTSKRVRRSVSRAPSTSTPRRRVRCCGTKERRWWTLTRRGAASRWRPRRRRRALPANCWWPRPHWLTQATTLVCRPTPTRPVSMYMSSTVSTWGLFL